jgi:hypothetical protein
MRLTLPGALSSEPLNGMPLHGSIAMQLMDVVLWFRYIS